MSRATIIGLLALLLAIPAVARSADKDYVGDDAGYLAYSVGSVPQYAWQYEFSYHRIDARPDGDWKGYITPRRNIWTSKIKSPDFVGDEVGHIYVRRLPPGEYVVDDFGFSGFLPGVAILDWSPSKKFSIPFTIRAGESTYIGTFMRLNNWASPQEGIGHFVIADRADRDLPLVKSRLPEGAKITVEITDVSKFGSRIFRTKAEPADVHP